MTTLDHIRGGVVEMGTCHEVGRILQTYLDGELNEARVAMVTAHLEHCRRGKVATPTNGSGSRSHVSHSRD